MQRVILLLLTVFTLYACATRVPHTGGDKQTLPTTPSAEPAVPPLVDEMLAPPVPEALDAPGATTDATILLPPSDGSPAPHIALLLPLKSATFGASANAVQQGFLAAANLKKRGLPIRAYGDFDENSSVVAVYRQALANGAVAVVGPLTRNGVAALAAEQYIPVPTLALNVVEGQTAQQLYFFGMSVEAEARRVAQLARQQGLQQAIIIATRAQLSQRMQSAFEDEWQASGGMILREIEFNDDPAVFMDLNYTPDAVVFLAANADKARQIRPYLSNKFPVYSTSQIFIGDNTLTNYDLNGIRFVDVPWLLQPDHPAVMTYPRASPPLPVDLERLYALGIDAYRLIQLLLANRVDTALPMDGVSGNIRLQGHIFLREPMLAVFQQGRAQLPDGSSALVPEVFPARIISVP